MLDVKSKMDENVYTIDHKKEEGCALLHNLTSAPPTECNSNELLEDLQRIYRLKAIINDYGNKAVRDIQISQNMEAKIIGEEK